VTCLIEKGKDGTVLYTAPVLLNANKESKAGMLQDVPKGAFVFVDKPYKSDMHLPNAFRHDITIPDKIFHDTGKNAAKNAPIR
jgi:hypothetical protein